MSNVSRKKLAVCCTSTLKDLFADLSDTLFVKSVALLNGVFYCTNADGTDAFGSQTPFQ